MIEINLLPSEMRQVEGTPPARLVTILAGVAVACVLGLLVGKTYIHEIPAMRDEIKNRDAEIAIRKKRKAEVETIIKNIETLNKKVQTLDGLILSRVRFARILDVLASAMPAEGVWFRSFSIQPLSNVGGGGLGGQSGKRFQINLQGYSTGPTDEVRGLRMNELQRNINQWFTQDNVDPTTKIHNFLGLRFNEAKMVGYQEITSLSEFKEPAGLTKEQSAQLARSLAPYTTKVARDFSMTLAFELPPPPDATAVAPANAPAPAKAK